MRRRILGMDWIELLLIAALSCLLLAVVGVWLAGVRAEARDAERTADVRNIEGPLEQYRLAKGAYPDCTRPTNDLAGSVASWKCLTAALVPAYLSRLPQDPSYPRASYAYDEWCRVYGNNTSDYRVWALLERADARGGAAWWNGTTYGLSSCIAAP